MLTEQEVLAVKLMVKELSKYCCEDLPGSILYTGAFRVLGNLGDRNGASVVDLSRKLELTEDDLKRAREAGVPLTE